MNFGNAKKVARCLLWQLSFVALFASVPGAAHAAGEKQSIIAGSAPRLALLIGNSKYQHLSELANPGNDARLIAGVLKSLGFEITLLSDLGRRAMQDAVDAFAAKLKTRGPETVGLVFFAGHGLEADATNYMVPVDADIRREDDIGRSSLSVASVAKQIAASGNQLNILVLDACRNNPYRNRSRSAATRGLTPMGAIYGVFIASSTASGDLAGDGDGANSPYATALAASIVAPGLKLEDVFKSVRRRVRALSDQRQIPWESSSLEADFYFIAPPIAKSPSGELLAMARETRSLAMLDMIQQRFRGTHDADEASQLVEQFRSEQRRGDRERQAQTQYDLASRLGNALALDEVTREFADTKAGARSRIEAQMLRDADRAKSQQQSTVEKVLRDSQGEAEAERAFKMAQESGSIAAYELIEKLFPKSRIAKMARVEADRAKTAEARQTNDALADRLFQRAERSQTPDAFEAVAQLYPDAPKASEALKRAARLRDAMSSAKQTSSPEGMDLVRAIRTELRRTGCSAGASDGAFDRQTVAALRSFATVSDDRFHWHRPTLAALRALQSSEARCETKLATRSVTPKCLKVLKETFCE